MEAVVLDASSEIAFFYDDRGVKFIPMHGFGIDRNWAITNIDAFSAKCRIMMDKVRFKQFPIFRTNEIYIPVFGF